MMMSVSKLLSFAAPFFFILFSLIKLCWCTGNSSTITCPEIEKQSLLSFKQSLQLLENSLSSWNDEVNCCNWEGVLCSNITGHVCQLSLQASNLDGQISPSLLNLKYLKYLYLMSDKYGYGASSLRVDSLEWLSGLSRLEYLSIIGVNLSRASHWQQQVINKLPSLVGLHLSGFSLNNTDPFIEVNNIATSNLTTLALSYSVGEDGYTSSGSIVPRWIFHLSNLVYLDLRGNNYEGPIPCIRNTTKLQHIDLSSNRFNSSIPEWLYTLKDLEFLDLSWNNLQGVISNSISNLTSLTFLRLHGNQLSGKLPRGISNLCKLQTLDLSYNMLEGEISDSFGSTSDCVLGALEVLGLSGNKLSGHLCHRFGEFKNLRYLYLGNDSFSDVIPSNLGNLSSLQVLDLGDNKLTGVIPLNLGNLFYLQQLSLRGNKLNGVIPSNLGSLSSLRWLHLEGNILNGVIPSNLGNLSSLQDLGLANNKLTGVIPSNLGSLSSLQRLSLEGNILTGNLPETIGQLSNLVYLSIRSNMLEGIVSETHFVNLSRLVWLFASGNQLTLNVSPNWIPPFKLRALTLGSWNLGSRIPSWLDTQKMSLRTLDLSYTGLYDDNVPNWIWSVGQVDLSHNQLHGQLPPISTTSAYFLDLSDNSFSGDLSHFLCNSTINNYARFTIINLGENHLTGELPNCFIKWSSLHTLNLSNNKLSGRIPDSIGFLASLQSLSLYGNNFSGDIPKQITSLVELRSLNLSGNRLTGSIPDTIGNMKNLESLDFSNNSLSGELPNSFTAMSSLAYLNVSYNELTGRIPECTQLGGFNESSFVGNNLCGPPLPRCEASGTMHPDDEGGGKPEIEWLYVFTSLGCAVGLSATLTTLFLKRSWREAYFEFIHDMLDSAYVYVLIKWRKLKTGLSLNM